VRDVLVIGGGIVGTAIAERLARDGMSVTLAERGAIGREASWAAAGLLTPVHPWNYPESMLALDAESLEMWPDLVKRVRHEVGIDLQLRATGLVMPIETDEEAAEAERRVQWKRDHGENAELLDADAAREAEPTLRDDVRGALLLPDLAQVRNHRAAPGLAAVAAKHGAEVLDDTAVLRLLHQGGRVAGARTTRGDVRAKTTVLAAGAWSGALLGDGAPAAVHTTPARGQILLLRTRPGELRHMVLGGDGAYLVPRADGRVLAGSTVEYVGFDRSVTVAGTSKVAASIERLTPSLADAALEGTWAGLRPDTPDHMPVMGEIEPGLIAATGHFRSGIMLAPVTAEIVREILRGEAKRDLAEFDPKRRIAS
jgi:glycine oxidase